MNMCHKAYARGNARGSALLNSRVELCSAGTVRCLAEHRSPCGCELHAGVVQHMLSGISGCPRGLGNQCATGAPAEVSAALPSLRRGTGASLVRAMVSAGAAPLALGLRASRIPPASAGGDACGSSRKAMTLCGGAAWLPSNWQHVQHPKQEPGCS